MKDDTIEELKEKLKKERERSERLEKELSEYFKVEECLVAAGLVSDDKIKQAHELVQTFSS